MKNDQGLAIGFCHNGDVKAGFMKSVMAFREYDAVNQRVLKAVYDQGGLYIAGNRNALAKQFLELEGQPQWFLMLDSDQTFTPQQIYQLLDDAHPEERPIMCGLYFGWLAGHPAVMWWTKVRDGEYATCGTVTPELQRINAAGMGCVLVHRSVLVAMRERFDDGKDPWIWFGHDMGSAGGEPGRLGEDFTFFKRAEACGFPVYGDGKVIIGHLKTLHYDMDMFMKLAEFLKPGEAPRERVLNGVAA